MAEAGSKLQRIFSRLFFDAGLSTMAAGLSAVFGLVRAGLMSRAVGVDGFGRLALALSAYALLKQVLSVRVWEWVVNVVADARARQNPALARGAVTAGWGIGFVIHLLVLSLAFLLARPISSGLLHDDSVVDLFRICALQSLVLWMDEPALALLRITGRYRWIAAYNVAGSALRTALVAAVAFRWPTVEAILGVQVAAQFVLSAMVFARGGLELRESFPGARADLASLWADRRIHGHALATLSATDTVKALTSELDPSVITFFAGSPAAAGAYRAAFAMVNGILQMITPTYFVVHAEITNAVARRDVVFLRGLMLRFTAVMTAFAISVAAVLGVGAEWIVPRLFGDGFASAVPCVRWMAVGLILPATGWAQPICVAIGRPGWYLRVVLAMLLVKLVALASLTSAFGATGAGAAYGLGNVAVVIVALFMLPAIGRRLLELPPLEASAKR